VEKKKVVRRAALTGAAIFATAFVLFVIAEIAQRSEGRQWAREAAGRVEQLRKEYQAYADETAQKIQGLPADPRVIGEIQARHYRALPGTWVYVWAVTNEGDFSFGVPSDAFTRLNAAYDFHRSVITEDNHYASREQFLRTLLHEGRAIPLRARDKDGRNGDHWNDELDWWRFRREQIDARHNDDATIAFVSSPIQEPGGKTVGNLNMKLVDRHRERSRGGLSHHLEPLAGAAMLFSFLWLWFLLPSWVYIDAREREMPRPLLWAFLTFVGNLFALMVYLISRPATPEKKELLCPKCQKALNGAKAGCPYCGADLSSAFCQQCQYPLQPEWSFCPACRTGVGKAAEPVK